MNNLITIVNVEGTNVTVPVAGSPRTELISLTTLFNFKFEEIQLATYSASATAATVIWHLNINGVDWHPYINRRMKVNNSMEIQREVINEHFRSQSVIKVFAQQMAGADANLVATIIGQYLKASGPQFPAEMFRQSIL